MTFNRPAALRRCLDSLANQSLAKDFFELVVVDVSADPVTSVLQPFRDSLTIRHFHTPNKGVAGNRNFGAEKARAELLAYIDDDCVAQPDWLEKLLACAAANPGCLIGGSVRNLYPDSSIACAGQVITEAVDACFNQAVDAPAFFPGLNFAVPRDRYLASGGCDESFGLLAAEDRDFADRWNRSGGRQVRAMDAVVVHAHRTDFRGFMRQYFNYGKGAWRYHSLRRARRSGGFSDSLKLHTGLWNHTREPVRGFRPGMRAKVYFLLCAWELSNAVGFAWQACAETAGQLFGRSER